MNGLAVKILGYLEQRSRVSILIKGLLLIVIVGAVDYFIVLNFSLSIFYLLPIILVSWFAGIWYGLLISILSALSWLINDFGVTVNYFPYFRFLNTVVRLVFFCTITYLLSALKTAYERQKLLAQTDELTGIINRRYFLDLLQQELNQAVRYEKVFTVAYFDLDNFKIVNDRFGHDGGDNLLKLVANTTSREIRQADIFARLGGDEFALLLPETDFSSSQTALQRLQTKLLTAMERRAFPVTFSIGAVTFVRKPNSVDEIIQKVDDLMYEVKRRGKNNLNHELYS